MNVPDANPASQPDNLPRKRRLPFNEAARRNRSIRPRFLMPDELHAEMQLFKKRTHTPGFQVISGTITTIQVESAALRQHLMRIFEQINGEPIPIAELNIEDFIDFDYLQDSRTQNIDLEGNNLELIIEFSRMNMFHLVMTLVTDDDVLCTGELKIINTPKGFIAETEVVRVDNTPELKEILGRCAMELDGRILRYIQILTNQTNTTITHSPSQPNPMRIAGWEKKFGPMLEEHKYTHVKRGKWEKIYTPEIEKDPSKPQ